MSIKLQENEILEYLNASHTARGFFITSVDIFEQLIQTLIERIFLKNDFAVQSVVGPLLQNSGPLGDLSVRLKLLFGLGVIPNDVYHDIESMVKLKNSLNNDSQEYHFTDTPIANSIKSLHLAKHMNMDMFNSIEEEGDSVFYKMQLDRQQQVIKSSLALAIISLCEALNKESPF
ncbi:MltR family transcriptional regulator [Psychromonas algicola]|uniref:MltR family transcriptional regulator n=1 Tax=Psychromonas algicola TaxID=2555642 RepID=UPI0010682081|nr:MltR family transcriptional regulator [Psychromonas sp. RZ5]TEW43198.1 MltR family transcriptional regulator [Psychromonas sp. RZ5]